MWLHLRFGYRDRDTYLSALPSQHSDPAQRMHRIERWDSSGSKTGKGLDHRG
jgi:hypothetical protein